MSQAQAQFTISGVTIRGNWTYSENTTSVSPVVQMSGSHGLMLLRQDGSVISSSDKVLPGFDIPKDLPPLKQICAGDQASAGVTFDGKVVTWGSSPYDIRPPLGLDRVKTVTTDGTHFAALRLDGSVVAWGDNSLGQSNVPAVLPKIIGIAALPSTTFLLGEDGKLIQLGTVQSRSDWKTGDPERKSDFTRISAGRENLVAIRADGSGAYFGNYSINPATKRIEIQPLSNVVEIYCTTSAVARLADGTIAMHNDRNSGTWKQIAGQADAIAVGRTNFRSQVWALTTGDVSLAFWSQGKDDYYYEPPIPGGFTGLKELDGGLGYALQNDGRIASLYSGKLYAFSPGVRQIDMWTTTYPAHSSLYILKTDGSVINGGDTPEFLKGKVFTSISAEYSAFVGLSKDGKVFSHGGVVGRTDEETPISTPADLPSATQVVTSGYVCMALLKTGQVRSWPKAELVGDPPAGLSRVVKIAAAGSVQIALQDDGTVVAWTADGLRPWSGRTGITDIYAETTSGILLRTRDGYWVEPSGQITADSPRADKVAVTQSGGVLALPSFSLKMRNPEVIRGTSLVGEIALRVPAPAGGTTLTLSSESPYIQIPSTVTVKAGQLGTTFLVKTASNLVEPRPVQLLARSGWDTQRASFLISLPLKISTFPRVVIGGTTDRAVATVSLGKVATKDTVVALRYSNSALHGPSTVTVPMNQSSVTFDVTADAVNLVTPCAIQASVNSQTASVDLNIALVTIVKLKTPERLYGGDPVDTAIELNAPVLAPTVFRIESDDPAQVAPFDITVPALGTTGTASPRCKSNTDARRSPSAETVTLWPSRNPTLVSKVAITGTYFYALFPMSGNTVTATLNLAKERKVATTYFITGDANVSAPASVTIPAGKLSIEFPVDCAAGAFGPFRLEASNDDGRAVVSGNIDGPPFGIAVRPIRFVGGSSQEAILYIDLDIKPGRAGVTFELSSSDGCVSLPKSATIPVGQRHVQVKLVHRAVARPTAVKVFVKMFNETKSIDLTVRP